MARERGAGGGAARLGAVEPEAAEAVEDARLQEAHPARVQLHDDRERRVRAQDDVIDHAGMVADPDVVGPVDRARPVVPDHARPGRHEQLAHELHQRALPVRAPRVPLRAQRAGRSDEPGRRAPGRGEWEAGAHCEQALHGEEQDEEDEEAAHQHHEPGTRRRRVSARATGAAGWRAAPGAGAGGARTGWGTGPGSARPGRPARAGRGRCSSSRGRC